MDPGNPTDIRTASAFRDLALHRFREQAATVPVYRDFCRYLNVRPDRVREIRDIPFLPIDAFKTHRVLREGLKEQLVFRSSGTTDTGLSAHPVADPAGYQNSFLSAFRLFYGSPEDWTLLALLPSYRDRPGSSLIYMVNELIGRSGSPQSGFIGPDPVEAAARIREAEKGSRPVLLLGVSFALLDVAEAHPMSLSNTVVMETGGMKGRRKEMVREALHDLLCNAFGQERIHSEYGMTELFSQAYSAGNGIFRCPPWMDVLIRDPADPLARMPAGRTGGIDIIDLANRDSCSFIATQDLGRRHADGSFEVLGRFDHSDVRGCNLLVV